MTTPATPRSWADIIQNVHDGEAHPYVSGAVSFRECPERNCRDAVLAETAQPKLDVVTLHEMSRRIRALPTSFGGGIAMTEAALAEREAVADFIDETAGAIR